MTCRRRFVLLTAGLLLLLLALAALSFALQPDSVLRETIHLSPTLFVPPGACREAGISPFGRGRPGVDPSGGLLSQQRLRRPTEPGQATATAAGAVSTQAQQATAAPTQPPRPPPRRLLRRPLNAPAPRLYRGAHDRAGMAARTCAWANRIWCGWRCCPPRKAMWPRRSFPNTPSRRRPCRCAARWLRPVRGGPPGRGRL